MTKSDHDTVFEALRALLRPYEARLVTVHDLPDHYYLDSAHIQANRKPLYFGSARIGKNYVSYHLMPVYLWPELLDDLSDSLRKRMQGKSCFNFRSAEPALLEELSALTQRGFDRYVEHGYVR